MLSGGSLGHPGILPWCPLRHKPYAVRRIPWTFQDPPFMPLSHSCPCSSLGHPGIFLWCPLRHMFPCCPVDPLKHPEILPWCPLQTQTLKLSGGSLGHPGVLPWCPSDTGCPSCPEDPLDIPGSSLGVLFRHKPSSCPENPRIPSLVFSPRAPTREKRSGEQSQISWASYPEAVKTNEIARSVIIITYHPPLQQ